MPTNTTNYNLVKPTKATDNADIDVINANMDTIDVQMKTNADAATSAQAKADAAIPATEKAAANGVATLDVGGTIPDAQIPAAITRDTELNTHKTAVILDHPDLSVTTAKLANGAVTAAKVAADVATQAELDAHTAATTAHGSTSAATAGTIMQRDAAGRAKVAAPSAVDDVARLDSITAAQAGAAPVSHVGSGGTAHALVTTAVAGFMASADKTKLNGIEAGATADQTAAEILTAIKTVDGAGSLLDADLLDGIQAAALAKIASGTYVGDDTTLRTVNLGVTPKMLFITNLNKASNTLSKSAILFYNGTGGAITDGTSTIDSVGSTSQGFSINYPKITTNGVIVDVSGSNGFNYSGDTYGWVAIY